MYEQLRKDLFQLQFESPERVRALALKAADMARELGNEDLVGRALIALSTSYAVQGDQTMAYNAIMQVFALDVSPALRSSALLRLAVVYLNLEAAGPAWNVLEQIERHWTILIGEDILMRARVLKARCHSIQNDHELARVKFEGALAFAERLQNKEMKFVCMHGIALMHSRLGEHHQSIEIFKRVLSHYQFANQHHNAIVAQLEIARSLIALGRREADEHLSRALIASLHYKFDLLTVECLVIYSQYYRMAGDIEAAQACILRAEERAQDPKIHDLAVKLIEAKDTRS